MELVSFRGAGRVILLTSNRTKLAPPLFPDKLRWIAVGCDFKALLKSFSL